MVLPEYELYAIRYAMRDAQRRDHFIGGDPHDAPMPIDYFVWIAKAKERAVVIDIGFTAEVRGKDVLPLLSGDLRPEMVEALKRVKAKFKTGCITNNLPANAIGSRSGRSLYVAEVMVLFDHVIESAKIGLRKPDPRIYQMMVETLKVDPNKCVYLDDLGVNLKPARAMGMTTIKVLSATQALDELEAATGMALR